MRLCLAVNVGSDLLEHSDPIAHVVNSRVVVPLQRLGVLLQRRQLAISVRAVRSTVVCRPGTMDIVVVIVVVGGSVGGSVGCVGGGCLEGAVEGSFSRQGGVFVAFIVSFEVHSRPFVKGHPSLIPNFLRTANTRAFGSTNVLNHYSARDLQG